MSEGRVKNFDILKGFGFITRPKGKDLFFHWSDIKSKHEGAAVTSGTLVNFEIDETKPNRAKNVAIVV